jgi:tetratricopeptide (TPR) repeat protein
MARKQAHGPKKQAEPRQSGKAGRSASATNYAPWAIGAVLFFAVWFAYAPALDNRFVSWDDQDYVTERKEVLDPTTENLAALWRRPVSLNYHPVTMMTLAWNSRSAARDRRTQLPEARPFISTNILLHALTTLLVLMLFLRLTKGNLAVSTFTALVFGLHPMHVESVAWVSERKDVLYGFFFVAGLLAYLLWVRLRKPWWAVATLVLFVLSCLSKAMAVVFPLVLVLIDVWEGRSLKAWRTWAEKVPLLAISLFFGLLAHDIQSGGTLNGFLEVNSALGRTGAVAETTVFPLIDRIQYGAYGYTTYLVKFFLPTGLCTFHPYPEDGTQSPVFPLSVVVMLAAIVLAFVSLRKGNLLFFGIGFFTLCIALVLQFVPVGRVIIAERYTYLPYIGLAFLVAGGIDRLLQGNGKRDAIWAGIIAGIGLVCIPLTRAQADVWQDTNSLFRQVIRLHPRVPDAYSVLGSWYGKRSGQERNPQLLDSAGMVLAEGIRAGAVSGQLLEAMGTYHGSQGRTDSALVYYNKAVAIGALNGQLLHNRAMTLLATDPDAAIADLTQAIALGHPSVGDSYALRGRAYYQAGRYADAIKDFDTAIGTFGHARADAFTLRGICHYQLGQREAAAADARTALRLDPNARDASRLLEAASQ